VNKRVDNHPTFGHGGTGVLKVIGKPVATNKMERTLPLMLPWDKNFDVGPGTGTPLDDKDYQVPFKFTGKLHKLTLTIDRPPVNARGYQETRSGAAEQQDE
jgi:hypothetical protein